MEYGIEFRLFCESYVGICIENIDISGWEAAIRGMRNPMNSWEKSDSRWKANKNEKEYFDVYYEIGKTDLELMTKLAKAGSEHAKYRRMITVTVDILAPLYWWKEFDTYKVGTVANSCSTMHSIHKKKFEIADFSNEHLLSDDFKLDWGDDIPFSLLMTIVNALNSYRALYLETKDKTYWWQMIQLLPSSYNQRRTVMLNYEVLSNIYHQRKDHKLDEWRDFCKWIESLPYSSEIIMAKRGE